MADIDIERLSLKELKKLQNLVTKAIDGFEERQRRDALIAVEAKAKEMGYDLSTLVGGQIKKTKVAVQPKYRHPENASLTWSGRGRQPGWIKEAEAAGKSRDDFLIKE